MPETGIRKIEDIEGGVIAWLHPGGADLDEALLEIARYRADEEQVEWVATTPVRREGPEPLPPLTPSDGGTHEEWNEYWAHRPGFDYQIDEEHPTYVQAQVGEIRDVGFYRRMPWCHCGDGHAWHFEPSRRGPGASLAIVVGGDW